VPPIMPTHSVTCSVLEPARSHSGVGDLDVADGYVRMLLDHATRYGLSFWLTFGRCYEGQLVMRRGDVTTGLQMLCTGLSEFVEGNTTSRFIAAQMAEALGQAGRVEEGLTLIEGAIERSQSNEELWATAELLRIKGELVRMQGIPEASAAAEDQFRQALELSRQQGALSWELRAATVLVRCYAIRAVPPKDWRSSSRSTTASPKASTRPT
jgi:hypothetical protein